LPAATCQTERFLYVMLGWDARRAGFAIVSFGLGLNLLGFLRQPNMNSLCQASGIMKNPISKALAVAYIAFVGTLIAWAVDIWHLRCEGFGCTGVGVAWLAWVGLFLPGLALGLGLGSCPSHAILAGRLSCQEYKVCLLASSDYGRHSSCTVGFEKCRLAVPSSRPTPGCALRVTGHNPGEVCRSSQRWVGKAQRAHADTAPVAACGSSKPRQNRVGTALWPLPTYAGYPHPCRPARHPSPMLLSEELRA
jgi:hypothetical protein